MPTDGGESLDTSLADAAWNQRVADPTKIGSDWDGGELDAIVADYFAMLAMEQSGHAYVKAHRAAALMDRIGKNAPIGGVQAHEYLGRA